MMGSNINSWFIKSTNLTLEMNEYSEGNGRKVRMIWEAEASLALIIVHGICILKQWDKIGILLFSKYLNASTCAQ